MLENCQVNENSRHFQVEEQKLKKMFLKNQNLPIDAKNRHEKKSRKGSTSSLT